jgi:YggT family protein
MLIMIVSILSYLLYILSMIILVQFVMSILITFNVINTYNEFVRSIWTALEKLTEPFYRPIRRILPDLGPIDFSPAVVLIIINIVRGPVLGYLTDLAYTL